MNINKIFNEIEFIEKNYYSLQGGVEIPPYADLNDYKNVGNYYCHRNAQAMTLNNKPPIDLAFTLKVYYATGLREYIAQRLCLYHDGKTYTRMYDTYTGSWNNWSPS